MRHHHGPNCGCPKQVVHPTKQNVVHHCTEETIQHVHPSHTTVMNHHLVKNQHVFPHSTSEQNTVNSVNEFGGAFNVPPRPGMGMGPGVAPGQVAGATSPGNNLPGWGNMNGTPNQVAGAMDPGMNPGAPGMGPGSMNTGMGPGMGPGSQNWKKPNKWC